MSNSRKIFWHFINFVVTIDYRNNGNKDTGL